MFFSNCRDKTNKDDNLQTLIRSILVHLLENFDIYAIPNAIDFEQGDAEAFIGYEFVINHNRIVDNE